jgi:hypothetical protein
MSLDYIRDTYGVPTEPVQPVPYESMTQGTFHPLGRPDLHVCPRHDFDFVADPKTGCPKCNAAPKPTEQSATQAGAGERYREQCAKGGRCLQGCLKAEQCFYAAPTEPAQPSREFLVPDAVWEALQRMIEDGVRRGPASREDAKAVADWRGRFWKKAEPAQPATQAGAGEMDSEHWAELFRLRNAVKGPDGYATWQDAATAERIRRVKAERALAEAAPTTEQPGDAERLRAVANIAHAGGLQGMSEGDALTAIRRLTIDHWTAHGKGGE